MRKYFKILKWLLKNQSELQKLIDESKEPAKKEEQRYSLAGVPEYQLEKINDILKKDNTL